MSKLWIVGLLCLLPAFGAAQQSTGDVVEMTKVDFVLLPGIKSTQLSLFGVRLGQTMEEVGSALNSQPLVMKTWYGHKTSLKTSYWVNEETSDPSGLWTLEDTAKRRIAEIYFRNGTAYKIVLVGVSMIT